MDKTRPQMVDELLLITDGLKWLSANIKSRDNTEEPNRSQSYAVTYATTQLRIVRRILDYVASQDDAVVLILNALLKLKLHSDIRDLAMIAIMGKRTIDSFTRYEQKLITQNIFGEDSKWA